MKLWRNKTPNRDYYAAPDAKDWDQLVATITNLQSVVTDDIKINQPQGSPVVFDGSLASINNPCVVGLVVDDYYQVSGCIELENWNKITGYNNLIPGAIYYLSMYIPGSLTTNPPDFGVIVEIGIALTNKKFKIDIKQPIFLE